MVKTKSNSNQFYGEMVSAKTKQQQQQQQAEKRLQMKCEWNKMYLSVFECIAKLEIFWLNCAVYNQ